MKRLLALLTLLTLLLPCIPVLAEEKSDHEPITIMDANRDYSGLIELVHEKYPEINIEIIPYHGRNTTAYMKHTLETGHIPDIYSTSQPWSPELQAEHLIDLSQYAVTDMYNPVRLNEYDVDGAIYLLPYDYVTYGILCNVSLLERHNIPVPTSFEQVRDETIPLLEAEGIEVATCTMNLPGYPFQFFFNIANTGAVNTLEGRQWQKDFLAGKQQGFDFLQSAKEYVQQWIDCGGLNMNSASMTNNEMVQHFKEGNTAFFMNTSYFFSQNDDGTGDQYVLLPYFSEDGKQNVYVTMNYRSYGLSNKLLEEGNEQKLEDALHVLEVMSTNEGFEAILRGDTTVISSLRDYQIDPESPYAEVVDAINKGFCATLIYNGWENYITTFGEAVRAWINGDITGDDALRALDAQQTYLLSQGPTVYATVTERLNTVQAAQLSGQMFLEATDADAALISYNIYQPGLSSTLENGYGANGEVLEGDLTDEYITTFLPTGWYDRLKTSELTGAQVKQLAKEGCDLHNNGYSFPYVLMTKDGQPIDDDATYTVIICGYTRSRSAELNLQDTGIVGLDAAKEYLLKVGTVSTATLDNSLVQPIE